MAQSRTTESKRYTNPEVRFERTDVEYKGIVVFGVVLAVSTLIVVVAMFWYADVLLRIEYGRKKTDLPPAAVDANRLPPEPRLEALEDIREGKPQLFPPRAREYFAPQVELLKAGDPAKGIEPIQQAIDQLANRLPSRPEQAAPGGSDPSQPSKAASGRTPHGGP